MFFNLFIFATVSYVTDYIVTYFGISVQVKGLKSIPL
jgi:hypothetical protein